MELETRLIFIDTSAYEKKKLQFGLFALARLERLVTEGKPQLLITDVVRSEIETHLKKFAHDAVTEHRKFRTSGSFLCIADEVTGGGLFTNFTAEAVFSEAIRKFRALVDNGYTKNVSVERVDPRQVFAAYFTGDPPFHRESKKSEFPEAFSLAAIDALARARIHKVYVVSGDGDMAAVADANDNFFYLHFRP
ncbi:PIN domain-containing protein [Pantoea osteomyelitidis]|uniref:PIN domain-containing protein n=1 Tax=Pantoea osteomyelitidis TaxID=3230026 RepID=A0ABW7Q124_9GAMM